MECKRLRDAQRVNIEIQAIRAIAIILVLVSHSSNLFPWAAARLNDAGKGFYVGVDLFLCLSGYVIAKGVARDMISAQGDEFWRITAAFWVRRLYRITPSAWMWLFLPLLAYTVFLGWSINNARSVAAALVYVANIDSWQCAWVKGNYGWLFGHYWSLSLEEQFYLLLPFLLLTFRQRVHYALIVIVAVQVIAPRPLGVLWGAIKTDALMLGVLIALWSETSSYRIFEPRIGILRWLLSPLLVACLVAMPRYEVVPFYIGMVAVLSAVIVWLSSYDTGQFIGPGPLRRMLAWIGERSFAIYLIHPFAMWAILYAAGRYDQRMLTNPDSALLFAVAFVALLLGLTELSYRFLERPFRQIGRQRSQQILAKRVSGS